MKEKNIAQIQTEKKCDLYMIELRRPRGTDSASRSILTLLSLWAAVNQHTTEERKWKMTFYLYHSFIRPPTQTRSGLDLYISL
jgi:hypothetical protein